MVGDESDKPKPGQWSDGTPTRSDDEQKFILEEGVGRTAKNNLIDDLVATGKITDQYAHLLRIMHTSTFGAEAATLRKVRAVMAMKDELMKRGIAQKRVGYIGSGSDWHYPVALGARDIVMVDIENNKDTLRQKLLTSIQQFDAEAKIDETNGSQIMFGLDLGNRREEVVLHLETAEASAYQPQEPLDCIVEYKGPSSDGRSRSPILTNIAHGLTNGGLIFNSDYMHDALYRPGMGIDFTEHDGFYLYNVTDRDQLIATSLQMVQPPRPDLGALRNIAKAHR